MNSIVGRHPSGANSLQALKAMLCRAFDALVVLGKLIDRPRPQAPLYPWPARHPAEIAILARQAHADRQRVHPGS